MAIHEIGAAAPPIGQDLNCVSAIDVERTRCVLQNPLIHERKKIAVPVETEYQAKVVKEECKRCRCGNGFELRCDDGLKPRASSRLTCVNVRHSEGR